jgi:hypothetical protein
MFLRYIANASYMDIVKIDRKFWNVVRVYSKCFICFRCMFASVFISGCCICFTHMLQDYVLNVLSVSVLCCSKCFLVASCKCFL